MNLIKKVGGEGGRMWYKNSELIFLSVYVHARERGREREREGFRYSILHPILVLTV